MLASLYAELEIAKVKEVVNALFMIIILEPETI
jgi:hypothetical protein